MKLIFVIFILGLFAVFGSQLSYFNRKLSMGFKNIILTGIEYIFAGILLGNMGLNILDENSITSLQPLLVFGICWVGFLLGLQLKFKELKKLPKHYFSITLITALVTFGVVFLVIYFSMLKFIQVSETQRWLLSLVLAAISCNTAQSAMAIVNRNFKFKNLTIIKLLRYISGMDGVISIILFSIILSVFSHDIIIESPMIFSLPEFLKILLFSLLIGLLSGFILLLISRSRFSQNEFILFLMGVILFFGGYASFNNLSPLFTGLICGMVFANGSSKRMQAMSIVIRSEKAIYIIMLIMLGAVWNFTLNLVLILGIIYVIQRMIGKNLAAFLSINIFKHPTYIPPWLGMGLLSEGGLSIVMVLNFKLLYPALSDIVVSIIVVSAIINELISPRLILSLFKKNEMELKNKIEK